MSVNYASGLSPYPNKGKCGMKEKIDSSTDIEEKVAKLATMFRNSKHVVVITGAGISTSIGIPDFRGPNGVWTLEEKGQSPSFNITFEAAKPSLTHMALVSLERAGYLQYVISQNVDGLHLRSGFPRNRLSELHGNMFVEECEQCRAQYIRASTVNTMALRHTGRMCSQAKRDVCCRGRLRDTILDWEHELPMRELDLANEHSRKADLCLCLGTSLQILPCGAMPLLTRRAKGNVVIVNLQSTKRDRICQLRIFAPVDDIMTALCKRLDVALVPWTKPHVILHSIHCLPKETPLPNIAVDEQLLLPDNCKHSIEENNGSNETKCSKPCIISNTDSEQQTLAHVVKLEQSTETDKLDVSSIASSARSEDIQTNVNNCSVDRTNSNDNTSDVPPVKKHCIEISGAT